MLVDEYQDTNKVQNELVLQLAAEHRNVCVVGDSDQCLPPGTPVSTPDGPRPIESLAEGDVVFGTGASSEVLPNRSPTSNAGATEGRMYRVRAGGRQVTGTPHHLVLARPTLDDGGHLVYLMYREDRGYRIGRTVSVRPSRAGQPDLGPQVRLNQEHGDRLWILGVYPDGEQASFWEAWFAATYGLPTACFHRTGRALAMSEPSLVRLYEAVDTGTAPRTSWRISISTRTSRTCCPRTGPVVRP